MTGKHRVLVATRSSDKLREIRQILAPLTNTVIVSLDDAGIPASPDEEHIEVYDTFSANARAKALHFARVSGLPTIADDSGISVHALGGRPGVHSRRFAAASADSGTLHGTDLDRANNRQLLLELSGVPGPQRSAHYTCVAALHIPRGCRIAVIGTRAGFILEQPRGTFGFGYDPLFLDPDTGLSFGETEPHLKNTTSHRSRAFRALAAHLDAFLSPEFHP